MVRNMFRHLPIKACGVIAAILACSPALAEQDALERSAPVWKIEKATSLVVTALAKAGPRLVAVGERGLVLIADGDGKPWRQAKVPVAVTLTGVAFSDVGTAWAVGHGGILLRSKDAGETWEKILDGKQAAALVAEAASAPGVDPRFREDAQRLVADGPDKPFLNVHFIDPNFGLIVGAYGLIFGTQDGGKSWKPFQGRIENPKGVHLYGILESAGDIWLSGEQGSLFVSHDSGASFKSIKTPYQGTFFGIANAGRSLVAFGMRGNAYWSDDQGRTWQKSEIPTSNSLTACANQRNGALVLVDDGGNVFESTDGGKKFQRSGSPKMPPLTSLVELTANQFLFGGARGLNRASLLNKTATETKQ